MKRSELYDKVWSAPIEPVRIFVGEAVEQHGLSTRLHKSLAEQDSKLIHR